MDAAANSPCLAGLALTCGHTFRCCTTTATGSPPITPPALLWQICGCGVYRSAQKRMNQGRTLSEPMRQEPVESVQANLNKQGL